MTPIPPPAPSRIQHPSYSSSPGVDSPTPNPNPSNELISQSYPPYNNLLTLSRARVPPDFQLTPPLNTSSSTIRPPHQTAVLNTVPYYTDNFEAYMQSCWGSADAPLSYPTTSTTTATTVNTPSHSILSHLPPMTHQMSTWGRWPATPPFGVYNTSVVPTALRTGVQPSQSFPTSIPPQPFQSVPLSLNGSNPIQRDSNVPRGTRPLPHEAQASGLNPQGAMSLPSGRPVGQPGVPLNPKLPTTSGGNRGGPRGLNGGPGGPRDGPNGGPGGGPNGRPNGRPHGGPGGGSGDGPNDGPATAAAPPPPPPPAVAPGPPGPPGPPILPGGVPPLPGGVPRLPDKLFVFQKKIKWELVPSWDGDGNSAIKWIKEVDNLVQQQQRNWAL
jgi:hypothetical protein